MRKNTKYINCLHELRAYALLFDRSNSTNHKKKIDQSTINTLLLLWHHLQMWVKWCWRFYKKIFIYSKKLVLLEYLESDLHPHKPTLIMLLPTLIWYNDTSSFMSSFNNSFTWKDDKKNPFRRIFSLDFFCFLGGKWNT